MAVKLTAFLALEHSLSSRIIRAWDRVASVALPAIYTKLQSKDILGATQLVDDLDLSTIMRGTRDYVRYLSLAAILFGASRFGRVKHSHVNERGSKPLTPLINRVTASFAEAITNSVGDAVRAKLYDAIIDFDLQDPSSNFAPSDGNVVFKAEVVHEYLRPFVEFQQKVWDEAQRLIQMISSLHTSRLAAFGYTEEALLLGATQYQITEQLDNKICEVCEIMHGKTFEVGDARELLQRVLLTDNPEELRTLQPWPKQNKAALEELRGMSNDDIVGRGWHIPPYHPWCRGQLVPVGKVPRIEDTPSYQAAFPTEATGDFTPGQVDAETFKSLGIDITPQQLELWNREIDTPPDQIMGAITGLPPQELSDKAYDPIEDDYSSLRYGATMLFALGEEERIIATLRMVGEFFGVRSSVTGELIIEEAHGYLRLSEVALAEEEEANFAPTFKGWVAAAVLAGLEWVEMEAGLDPSGLFWTEYGAVPNYDGWFSFRRDLREAIDSGGIGLTEGEAQYVLSVLDQSDEGSFTRLVGLNYPAINDFIRGYNLTVYLQLDETLGIDLFTEATGG